MMKSICAMAAVIAATVTSPAIAAYTLFTGDAGGFTSNSATSDFLAAQVSPTEYLSFDRLKTGAPTPGSGEQVNGTLFSNGVSFASANGPLITYGVAGGGQIGPSDLSNFGGTLVITLATAARAVGLGTVNPGVAATFFDPAGGLVQTAVTTDDFGFVGLVGDQGSLIKTVRLTSDFFAIQDFQYAVAAPTPSVPEPATWAMMMLGFGFVGAAARRRRLQIA